MRHLRIIAMLLLLTAGLTARAQLYRNNFDNGYTWYPPWENIALAAASPQAEGSLVCVCDSTREFGLGFNYTVADTLKSRNLHLRFEADFRFPDTIGTGEIALSVIQGSDIRYWTSYQLSAFANDSAQWFHVNIEANLPNDYLEGAHIKLFLWNRNRSLIHIDNAELDFKPYSVPSYQPIIEIDSTVIPTILTLHQNLIPIVEYINIDGDTVSDPSVIESDINWNFVWPTTKEWKYYESNCLQLKVEARFKEDVKLLRLAVAMPLPDGEIIVYRRNQHIDSTHLQPSYYLDREGFAVKNDSFSFTTYHNTGISSLQLDTEHRTACFNIDYWRDHPLIHYPLRTDTTDCFEDISYRAVKAGEVLKGEFNIYCGGIDHLPRIMPIWDGYESAFIFTEHADWTDLRTHQAVLFGKEGISSPEDAIGGFCYFNIPVTKSVFYWNPDNVTNEQTSKGRFPGLHATIKTDKAFFRLLKTLRKKGFEICLHTPEQYTTIPSEFPKALRFMKRNFNTRSWIDHGYNNGPDNNRENMVCDGLLPDSPQYASELWRKNGVRYLWNAYYEENRMVELMFDGNFVQPYDGFGDALPNRQITTLPNGNKDFLLWSTPSTLEVNEDREWYYYFDSIRLQRLVDNHNVFITHIYPAWTNPWRAFWQYDENGTAVAMPGFNFALKQLSDFQNNKKILLTTIEQYLGYYEKLLNVDYHILNDNTIGLTNQGEDIEGLTLLCSRPIIVEDKPIDFRQVNEGYLVWFNLKKNETVNIIIRE